MSGIPPNNNNQTHFQFPYVQIPEDDEMERLFPSSPSVNPPPFPSTFVASFLSILDDDDRLVAIRHLVSSLSVPSHQSDQASPPRDRTGVVRSWQEAQDSSSENTQRAGNCSYTSPLTSLSSFRQQQNASNPPGTVIPLRVWRRSQSEEVTDERVAEVRRRGQALLRGVIENSLQRDSSLGQSAGQVGGSVSRPSLPLASYFISQGIRAIHTSPSRASQTLTERQAIALAAYLASEDNLDGKEIAIRELFEAFSDQEINEFIESLSDIEFESLKFELLPPYVSEDAEDYALFNNEGDFLREFKPDLKHKIIKISKRYGRFIVNFINVEEDVFVDQLFIEQKIAPYLASAILKKYRFSLPKVDEEVTLTGMRDAQPPQYTQKYDRAFLYLLEYFSSPNSIATFGIQIQRRAFIDSKNIPFAFTLKSFACVEDLPSHVKKASNGNLLHCLKIERFKADGLKDEVNLWIDGEGILHLICDQNNYVLLKLPVEFKKGLLAFVETAALDQSKFKFDSESIELVLPKKALQACPKFYLYELVRVLGKFFNSEITNKKCPHLKITYTGHDSIAIDAGGITRDFLRTLFESLVDSRIGLFLYSENFDTYAPIAKSNSFNESKFFKNIGMLLMYCLQAPHDNFGNKILAGRFFDDALFKALLSLSVAEVAYNYEKLPHYAKFQIYKALLKGRKAMGDDVDQLLERVKFVSKLNMNSFDQMSKEEIRDNPVFQEAFRIAETHNLFHSSLFDELEGENDIETLSNPKNVKILMRALESSISSKDLGSRPFSDQIAPIYDMACGMLDFLVLLDHNTAAVEWEKLRRIPYLEVSSAIQGNIDRLQVANFEINRSPTVLNNDQIRSLEKKTLWLQEWLVGKVKTKTGFSDQDAHPKATDEEVRKFLIFATGTSSLTKDKQIKILHQNGQNSLPKSHTCQQSLEISPDFIKSEKASHETKEEFIKCIQEALPATEFGFE